MNFDTQYRDVPKTADMKVIIWTPAWIAQSPR